MQPLSQSPAATVRPVILAAAVLGGAVIAGTVALWAHYGTAVFTETILSGIAACF